MEEIGLRIIYWLIIFTGSLAITYGLLHLVFLLLGKIIKYLGYWKLFMQALGVVARDNHKKRLAKENGKTK